MNNERRKAINANLKDLRAESEALVKLRDEGLEAVKERIESIKGFLEEIKSEEQDYLDNMPESFQQGDRGQKAEEAVNRLDDVDVGIDEMIGSLDEAIDSIAHAVEKVDEAADKIDDVETDANAASE